MKDMRVGLPIVTVKAVGSIVKGRIGLVSEFKRNPKNDAIEVLNVNFGEDDKGNAIIVNIDDLQTIRRLSIGGKKDDSEI